MNPIVKLLIDALLKYIKEHPDEVEKVVKILIEMFIKWLEGIHVPPSNSVNRSTNVLPGRN